MTPRRRTAPMPIVQARRIALAAQGFAASRPAGRVDRRHVRRMLDRVALVQVDSVNVVARSEELVAFARLGPHDRTLVRSMDDAGELFEYWAHEASLLPIALEPLLRHRKQRALAGDDPTVWKGLRNLHIERPDLVEGVYDEVSARGPVTASALSGNRSARREHWGWNWDDAKSGIANLFWTGRIASRRRTLSFEREYDLAERCLPAAVLDVPAPDEADARRELVRRSAKAHGIGTARCLADYFRLPMVAVRPILDELVADGELIPTAVEGWTDRAYLWSEAVSPRRVTARALLSPFDPVVWERTRTERLFGFRYRTEIYVPKDRRVYGYYVLPFLLGEELVARVDLKSDRKAGVLRVQATWAEPGINRTEVARELAAELVALAEWLGLADGVQVVSVGDLHEELATAVGAPTALDRR
jgi:uncharacterized protein